MGRYGVSRATIGVMADLFAKIRVSVKTNGTLSESFKPMRGFPQGRPASPIQWSISYDGGVLDDLCRAGLCYRIDCGDLAIFIFADDTMFVCNCPRKLQGLITCCRWLIHRVEMKANVKKSAVMIFGDKYLQLKKRLKFFWGPDLIPIVKTYKYLGIHFDDMFPRKKWSTYHMSKVSSKANISTSRCSPFLTNKRIPIDWRISNFQAMVAPMYTYGSMIWHTKGGAADKLISSYNRKLRATVGCETRPNSLILLTMTAVQPLEFWWEFSKVLFKYSSLRKNVPGTHRKVFALSAADSTHFMKWSSAECHNDVMRVGPLQRARKSEIKEAMLKWKRAYMESKGLEMSNTLDLTVLRDFVCHRRHYMHQDMHGYVIASKYRPRYTKWLSNTEFLMAVDSLGGGNNLLDENCVCFQCGIHTRSWEHITRTCSKMRHPSYYPNLDRATRNKKECVEFVGKLRRLVRAFTPSPTTDLCGRYVSVLAKHTFTLYFIAKRYDDGNYRMFNLETEQLTSGPIWDAYTKGKVAIMQ